MGQQIHDGTTRGKKNNKYLIHLMVKNSVLVHQLLSLIIKKILLCGVLSDPERGHVLLIIILLYVRTLTCHYSWSL